MYCLPTVLPVVKTLLRLRELVDFWCNMALLFFDLTLSVRFLEQHYEAPQLLIGHSLGGAAVLAMAAQLPKVTAVVTIGAPYEASHVIYNFNAHLDTLEKSGKAKVSLGTREFTIKIQFLEDLRNQTTKHIQHLNKALLVLH